MSDGFFVTKKQAVIICVLFMLIIIGVGLMAGLIPDRGDQEIILLPVENPDDGGDITDGPWTELRLPSYINPVHYNLWFSPDFYHDGTTFEGRSDIEIEISQETEYILIHYKLMEITTTQLQYKNGESIEIAETFPYEPHEYWVIQTTAPIPKDSTVMLHLEFNGSLVNGIVGYYKSTYINSLTGEESWLATTKFQPTDARKAFPCFDEPAIKAQYTISLHHWANFTGLSNMPEESIVDHDNGYVTTTFGRTVTMSTYLVCFIVTDFDYIENIIEVPQSIPSRIWAAPDLIEAGQAQYALETTKTIFEYNRDLFDYEYPLPKLDQVAVPDYPSGATEHWGLMTYRQAYLLYDESSVSSSGKQTTASIISHEVAHNYFGNEVTCAWWDEIWLNEGFAVYFENHGVTRSEPDWEMDEHFVLTTQQGVMRTDAGANSRSVVVEVETPEQINAAFDGITYDKGASMLRMIESFMGWDSYIKGIRRYLHSHLKDVAVTDDLWNAFQQISDEDGVNLGGETFSNIMNPWVHQMGLPVITITVSDDQITCQQSRFMNNDALDPNEPPSDYNYIWHVPLTYNSTGSTGSNEVIWIHDNTPVVITDPRDPGDTWLKFNNGQKGFYRVNYPSAEWQIISDTLINSNKEFSSVDRSNLMDDAFNLARAGALSYEIVLDMAKYLVNEDHLFPWRSSKSGLDYIANMIYGEPSYVLWRAFIRDISSQRMDELGFEDDIDQHLDELLRMDIIDLTCTHGYDNCKNEIQIMFNAWIADEDAELSPTLKPLIYEFGITFSDDRSDWELMRDRYLASNSSQEKAYMLEAMAQTQDMYLIDRYLEFIEDPANVRDQDFVNAVDYTARNKVAYLYTWNWIKTNYEEMEERFGIEDRTFARMVPNYVMDFNTQYLYDDVSQFYKDYPEAGAGELTRQQSLDSIQANIAWIEDNLETISRWLRDNYASNVN